MRDGGDLSVCYKVGESKQKRLNIMRFRLHDILEQEESMEKVKRWSCHQEKKNE